MQGFGTAQAVAAKYVAKSNESERTDLGTVVSGTVQSSLQDETAPDELKNDVSAAAKKAAVSSTDSRMEEEVADRVVTKLRDQLRGPRLVKYNGWVGVDVVDERGRALKISQDDHEIVLSPERDYEVQVTIGPQSTGSLPSKLCILEGDAAPFVDFIVELDSDESALRQPPVQLHVGLEESATARIPLRIPPRSKDATAAPWLWVRVTQQRRTIQSMELRTRF